MNPDRIFYGSLRLIRATPTLATRLQTILRSDPRAFATTILKSPVRADLESALRSIARRDYPRHQVVFREPLITDDGSVSIGAGLWRDGKVAHDRVELGRTISALSLLDKALELDGSDQQQLVELIAGIETGSHR